MSKNTHSKNHKRHFSLLKRILPIRNIDTTLQNINLKEKNNEKNTFYNIVIRNEKTSNIKDKNIDKKSACYPLFQSENYSKKTREMSTQINTDKVSISISNNEKKLNNEHENISTVFDYPDIRFQMKQMSLKNDLSYKKKEIKIRNLNTQKKSEVSEIDKIKINSTRLHDKNHNNNKLLKNNEYYNKIIRFNSCDYENEYNFQLNISKNYDNPIKSINSSFEKNIKSSRLPSSIQELNSLDLSKNKFSNKNDKNFFARNGSSFNKEIYIKDNISEKNIINYRMNINKELFSSEKFDKKKEDANNMFDYVNKSFNDQLIQMKINDANNNFIKRKNSSLDPNVKNEIIKYKLLSSNKHNKLNRMENIEKINKLNLGRNNSLKSVSKKMNFVNPFLKFGLPNSKKKKDHIKNTNFSISELKQNFIILNKSDNVIQYNNKLNDNRLNIKNDKNENENENDNMNLIRNASKRKNSILMKGIIKN